MDTPEKESQMCGGQGNNNHLEILLNSVVSKLATEGWTLPSQMTLGMAEQIGRTNDISDINTFLHAFFTRKNYAVTKKMICGISSSCTHLGLKKVVNECWIAFQNNLYAVCAIALLTVIEGMLSDFSDDKQDIRMMRICQKQVDYYSRENKYTAAHLIEKYVWESYNLFIRNLYRKSDFTFGEPDIINRHWLLHGRSEFDIAELDCIRLFNALDSLCMVIKKDTGSEGSE